MTVQTESPDRQSRQTENPDKHTVQTDSPDRQSTKKPRPTYYSHPITDVWPIDKEGGKVEILEEIPEKKLASYDLVDFRT